MDRRHPLSPAHPHPQRDEAATAVFLRKERPDAVVLTAAKVGGIMANSTYPVQFIEDNLRIQLSVIAGAHAAGVRRLLFLGSSCICPRVTAQPITEEALLTGPLEPTNEAYALAEIAGIVQAQSYRKQYGASYVVAMPGNLYGPGDDFDLKTSHVLLLRRYDSDAPVNVGCGYDLTIHELARTVADAVGFTGELVRDTDKPDGTPRKLLDTSRPAALGWQPRIPLGEGIAATYQAWRQAQA